MDKQKELFVTIRIKDRYYKLPRGNYVIGRQGDEPFRSALANCFYVSRLHCTLSVSKDGVIVRDIGSLNGTFLNGERINETEVRNGDEIVLGDTSKNCYGAGNIEFEIMEENML